MYINTFILVVTIVIGLLLCLMVLLRNYRKPDHIAFAFAGISLLLWSTFNVLSQEAQYATPLLTRITGAFGALTVTGFYALSLVFPKRLRPNVLVNKTVLLVAIVILGLCMSNLLVRSAYVGADGLRIETGALYILFPLYLISIVTMCFQHLWRQYTEATRIARSQLTMLWVGILTTTFLALVSNVIIPAMTDEWASVKLGPLFTLPFIGLTAYAVLKQRMFSLKLVIVRSLGYTITVGIVTAIYSLALIVVTTHTAKISGESYRPLIISLIVTTFFVSLTFHRIQQFITRVTFKLFYQHAYSLREVLDTLSNILVKENKPEFLMRHSLHTLSEAIRPHKAHFIVFNEHGAIQRQYSINDAHTAIEQVIPDIFKEHALIVDRDEHPHKPLAVAMEAIDMQLCLRLGNRYSPVGAILFGTKKTGGIYTPQDIQLLTIAARNLSIAIENAQKYEQISHFADTLQDEVKHATTRLRHANDKLKALDKMKDDFISMASHQFRTPAGAIRQALHMINNPALSPKEKKEILKLAEASSEQLVTIVGTMLNISRIEAGKFVIDRSLADMVKLGEKILLTTGVLAEQKNTKLVFDRPDEPIMLNVDVAKVNEAMANYIENAIKYSPTNSTITIHLRTDDHKLYFEVEDQGMGVPQEERPHLFGKFYRAQNARREQPDGNGIGLYVVRQIIRGHGGDTYYEPLETGSRFGFWLPLK